MECNVEFETGETGVGCEEVLDISGLNLEWEWSNVGLESGELYVGQNNYDAVAGKVLDMIGLKADVSYDMEWDDVDLESDEVYDMEWNDVELDI